MHRPDASHVPLSEQPFGHGAVYAAAVASAAASQEASMCVDKPLFFVRWAFSPAVLG